MYRYIYFRYNNNVWAVAPTMSYALLQHKIPVLIFISREL